MDKIKPPSLPTSLLVEKLSIGLYESFSEEDIFNESNSIAITDALDLVIKHHELKEEYEVCAKVLKFKNNITYV